MTKNITKKDLHWSSNQSNHIFDDHSEKKNDNQGMEEERYNNFDKEDNDDKEPEYYYYYYYDYADPGIDISHELSGNDDNDYEPLPTPIALTAVNTSDNNVEDSMEHNRSE